MTTPEQAPITDAERENVRQVVESFAGTDYEWSDITDDELDDLVRSVRDLDEFEANNIMTKSNALGIYVGRYKAIASEAWYGLSAVYALEPSAAYQPPMPAVDRNPKYSHAEGLSI